MSRTLPLYNDLWECEDCYGVERYHILDIILFGICAIASMFILLWTLCAFGIVNL